MHTAQSKVDQSAQSATIVTSAIRWCRTVVLLSKRQPCAQKDGWRDHHKADNLWRKGLLARAYAILGGKDVRETHMEDVHAFPRPI